MKYPTCDGLVISPFELGYEKAPHIRGKVNNHHSYYPKNKYSQIPLRHTFRNLVDHVQTMWIPEHDSLHRRYSEAQIPHEQLMIEVLDEYMALNGVINLVLEKATNQTREMSVEQWNQIKLNYRSG